MSDWWDEIGGMSSVGGISSDSLGGGAGPPDEGGGGLGLAYGGGAPAGYPAGGYPELTPSPWEADIANAVPQGENFMQGIDVPYEAPPSGALQGWTRTGPGGTTLTFDPGEWVAFYEATHQKKIQSVLNASARRIGNIVRDTMRRNAPKDTGLLANTIAMDVDEGSGDVKVKVYPTQPYAGAVETGSTPHMVSISAIAGWADRHGIPPGALQHHIAVAGTQAHPFIEPTKESVDIQLENLDPWGEVFGGIAGVGRAFGSMLGAAVHWMENIF